MNARKQSVVARPGLAKAQRIEQALITSIANVPNTFVYGLKYVGLGLAGHIREGTSRDEDGNLITTVSKNETAQRSLDETTAWRVTPPPGTEDLSHAYDVVLPLAGAAVLGGNSKPGAGPASGVVLAETKETVSLVGAVAADGPPLLPEGPPVGDLLVDPSVEAAGLRTAKEANISPLDAARIQAVVDKTGARVTVVGSRAAGKASPWSDWDYIIEGKAKARSYARWKLPHGVSGGEFDSRGAGTGIDVFTEPLDPAKPHVIFETAKKGTP